MKRLILVFVCLLLLLTSLSCNSNLSHPKKEITEQSQVYLPVVNEFAGEITPKPGSTHIPTPSATAPQETGAVPEQEMALTRLPAGSNLDQNSEENSKIVPYKPYLYAPIPDEFNQEIEQTYRYGSTQNGTRIPHDGVEFYNASGTPVLNAADGIVYFAGSDDKTTFGQFTNFYGNLVIIKHNIEGFELPIFTLYAHLSSIEVNTGDKVILGEKIGEVGASGSAIGSHLHFEVRIGKPDLQNRVNPELYLSFPDKTPEIKSGILVGRILDQQGEFIPQNHLVIQLIEDGKINPDKVYYLESYASNVPSDPRWKENFVISRLPAGHYRITTFIENQLIEKYVDIDKNSVTNITMSRNN